MKDYTRYVGMNHEIRNAMLQVDNRGAIEPAVSFWSSRDEKFTKNRVTDSYYLNSFFPSFPSRAWNTLADGYNKIAFEHKRIPIQADIAITGDCHCNCWHCFRNKHGIQQLNVSELQVCFEDLKKLGTCTVGLTGGEPMLHPQIKEIISSIPETMEGQLYTTGHGIDKEFVAFLNESKVTRCIISLDHYDAEKANRLRQYETAFTDAMKALEALYDSNIYTAITVCITEQLLAEGELEKYFSFASQLPINEIRIVLPIPQGKLEGKDVRTVYANAIRKIKIFKKENALSQYTPTVLNFCEFESSSYIGCSAGANYISINNDGHVLPCVAVPLAFGNTKKKSLIEIFSDMERYFHNSGRVCYGKRIGRIMASQSDLDTSVSPLPIDISQELAAQCVVQGKRAAFFENVQREKTMEERLCAIAK